MSFISELKRRNVFKVGVAYLALGWVMIEVTSMAVPALNLPESLNKIVFFLGLIGFPFALLFAWAFELTPDGVIKTEDGDGSHRETTGKLLNYSIMTLLALALGFFIWESRFSSGEQDSVKDEQGKSTISVAVLPFVNMSSDPEQEYFSDGISEEILNMLAQIPDLHVTSRSSAFSFKGTNTDIPTIATQLGVANVLEGSVRKSGNRIRITAQLIEAASDKHLWSETYDREISDIFAIQDEISLAITDALKVKLMGEEMTRKAPTKNLEAYNLYLKGHDEFLNRTGENLFKAIGYLKQAIELDPYFANAWADLASVYTLLDYYAPKEKTPEIEQEKIMAINKAISLDPTLAQAWAIKGYIHFGAQEWQEAASTLTHALKLNPNNESALLWSGLFYASMGHLDKSAKFLQQAVVVSPLMPVNHGQLGRTLSIQGKNELAKKSLKYATDKGWFTGSMILSGMAGFEGKVEEALQLFGKGVPTEVQNLDHLRGYIKAHHDPSVRAAQLENLNKDFDNPFEATHLWGSLYIMNAEQVIRTLKYKSSIPSYYLGELYGPSSRALLNDPAMKAYFKTTGVVEYWRMNGWPDICEPVGADDFKCAENVE